MSVKCNEGSMREWKNRSTGLKKTKYKSELVKGSYCCKVQLPINLKCGCLYDVGVVVDSPNSSSPKSSLQHKPSTCAGRKTVFQIKRNAKGTCKNRNQCHQTGVYSAISNLQNTEIEQIKLENIGK